MFTWFNNLKVSAKLLSSFIIILILTGIVGGVGIYAANTLNNLLNETYL